MKAGGGRSRPETRLEVRAGREKHGGELWLWRVHATRAGEEDDAMWRLLVGPGLAGGAHTCSLLACELQLREGVCINICGTVII